MILFNFNPKISLYEKAKLNTFFGTVLIAKVIGFKTWIKLGLLGSEY